MSITLHGYWRSSATWRVRIALELKGLNYSVEPVHLLHNEQTSEAHLARNPMGQVPALVIDGKPLGQSVAILEFLDELHPAPALLPDDPWERAYVRQLVEIVNSGIQPLQNLATLRRLQSEYGVERSDWKPWAAHYIARGFEALETLMAPRSDTYACGNAVSLADICLAPQVYNAHRFSVDMSRFPTIARVDAACALLPAFQAAHPDRQPDAAH